MTGKNITHLREITDEIGKPGIKLVEANVLYQLKDREPIKGDLFLKS